MSQALQDAEKAQIINAKKEVSDGTGGKQNTDNHLKGAS